jgi:hypothetical protein
MKINEKDFVIRAPHIYLFSLVILSILVFILLAILDPAKSDSRIVGAASGLLAGLIIASLQFLTQYLEQTTLAEYRKHGLKEFLINRKDAGYYRELIKKTQVGDNIIVVGVTCNRLLEDFASAETEHSQDLLEALARGVKVKLLLPKLTHLNKTNKSEFLNKTLIRSEIIKKEYPGRFSILYFDFEPSHSIFLAGSRCVVGPIFKNISSKDTPAIVFDKRGQYIKPYLSYIADTETNASAEYD